VLMPFFDVEGKTAVIYARVSTEDKEQRPEVQVDLCKEWCAKNGVKILGIYIDKHTGKELERPGFEAMMGKIMTAKPGILIVYDQSRLTRDMKLEDIKQMLKFSNTQILYVTSPDVDPKSLAGQMADAVNGVFNKEFVVQNSQKTKDGMNKSRKDGIHIGRPATFVISEDIDRMPNGKVTFEDKVLPDGKIIKATKIISETLLFLYAKQGHSLGYVAKMEGIKKSTLLRYLHGTKEPAIPGNPDSIIPNRFDEYAAILEKADCPKRGTDDFEENSDSDRLKRGVSQKGIDSPENPSQKGGVSE